MTNQTTMTPSQNSLTALDKDLLKSLSLATTRPKSKITCGAPKVVTSADKVVSWKHSPAVLAAFKIKVEAKLANAVAQLADANAHHAYLNKKYSYSECPRLLQNSSKTVMRWEDSVNVFTRAFKILNGTQAN